MTLDASTPAALLEALLAAPEGERQAIVQAAGPLEQVLSSLGDEAERLAVVEVNRALAASEVVVGLTDKAGSLRSRARARRARAYALSYSGRFQEALAAGRDAASLAEQSSDPVEAARARLGSIHALGELGRYDEAIQTGEAARRMLLDAGQPELAARADINLGITHQNRDDPRTALIHLDRAREVLRGEPNLLGFIENSRGEALLLLNDFSGAEAAFLAALHVYEVGGSNLLAAIVEGNLAELAVRQGVLQRALYHFERARRRLELDGAGSHLARLLAEHADALEILGAANEALAGYEAALPRLKEHGLKWETGRALAGLARTLLRLDRPDDAERSLLDAAAIFESLGNATAHARVDLLRARLAADRGNLDEARRTVTGALAALRDRPADAAVARHQLACLALMAGDLAAAEVELSAAIPTIERLDIAPLLADLYHARAQVARGRYDLPSAVNDLQAAVGQVERVRGSFQAERFRAAYLGDRLRIYEDLVKATLDQGDPAAIAHAFSTVEKAKSRSLLDLVRGALDLAESAPHDAADPAEVKLLAELARLRSELSVLYSRLAPSGPSDHRSVADAAWQNAVHEREQALNELEQRLTTTRGIASLFAVPVGLTEVQREIPSDAALIEYYCADGEVLAFVLRRDDTEVFRGLASEQELHEAIARVHFQLRRATQPVERHSRREDRLLQDARRELHSLWKLLIKPIRSRTDGCARLIIVPHGQVHLVPFNALWDGEQHLIQGLEVCYSPSSSLFVHSNVGATSPRRGVRRNGGAVVVGVADSSAPEIAGEAAQVAEILAPARVLLNDGATVGRFSDASPAAATIHIACHGRFSSRSPLGSGLKLADRWLTVRDVFGLSLSADLVTLSGCETGRNLIAAGDELLGLVRGFLAAGARSLLVSLWVASDKVTAGIMGDFYRLWHTLSGNRPSKAAALRQAQLNAMSHHPHPAFWAPFILVGRT